MNEDLRLECVECSGLTEFERRDGSVYCSECGRRHSSKSLVPEWGITR